METTLGEVIVEVGKCITRLLFSSIATLVNFHGNIKDLQNELEKLTSQQNSIKEGIELAKAEGKLPTAQADGWLKKVEEIQCEVNPMLEEYYLKYGATVRECSLNCNIYYRYQLSKGVAEKLEEVKQLIDSSNFQPVLPDGKSPLKPVERMSAPTLVGQKALEMLERLMELLNDDGIKRIAVWGMGGIGKTALVRNLNNKLESSSMTVSFDVVIWVRVSKDLDLRTVQSRIAERLNLDLEEGESMQGRANRLLRRLMLKKKFLLILDDVWEKIDLEIVGIPQGDDQTNGKILLTTRSFDVCRKMMTNAEIKVDVLSEEVAWNLFAESAGNVVELEGIEPLARAIAKKCCGLPLAIKTMGKSMRAKTMIELWRNALCQLRRSATYFENIKEEVYLPLKLSYNSLQSKVLQCCFLYCSLYPENFSIDTNELIHCWMADGLIVEHQTLEESFNNGIALIENLKDSCMLEHGEGIGTVKMHDVVRDVAIWISSTEEQSGFFCQSDNSLHEVVNFQTSYRRISFVNNMIMKLPSRLLGCSELTVLFLQGNHPLKKIPDGFFRELRALRVLNLSGTLITSLPPFPQQGELRALFLRNCRSLEKLPPLGALSKLQVLDLFGTRLRELPKEIGNLGNLMELNLSCTHHLENIEAGAISGLSGLEALDMSFSAYKWGVKCNVEGGAAFDELLSLKRLSVLRMRLDTVDCLALDPAWPRRLRRFDIRISPRSCDSNYQPTQHDEKRVILRGVDLLEIGLEGLLCEASALDLVTCGGISGLSEIVGKASLHGLASLKSLTITSCDWNRNLISGEIIQGTVLPNLEHLTLRRLRNLETLLDGAIPNGECLGRLRTIEVVDCPRLKNLMSYALLRRVKNLEEIRVSVCGRMKNIITGRVSSRALPKLKVIEMKDLINLRTICSNTCAWPSLERLEVRNCPMLKNLPLSASNAITLKEIRGDLRWWNNIVWEDDEIKLSLEQRLQACPDDVRLAREDIWA
ncbi:hypothetical protein L1049_001231 [Liquidambar formosana]|uniref:Disease resistance protein n=1 Tax=Liquidambar formosana TaxID=63359 RepID=A0AAP0R435_LIQFO